MTNPAKYKLATQAILMAYELLAPDPRSTDDLKQHLAILQMGRDKAEYSAREIFFETMTVFDEAIKGKWFYRD